MAWDFLDYLNQPKGPLPGDPLDPYSNDVERMFNDDWGKRAWGQMEMASGMTGGMAGVLRGGKPVVVPLVRNGLEALGKALDHITRQLPQAKELVMRSGGRSARPYSELAPLYGPGVRSGYTPGVFPAQVPGANSTTTDLRLARGGNQSRYYGERDGGSAYPEPGFAPYDRGFSGGLDDLTHNFRAPRRMGGEFGSQTFAPLDLYNLPPSGLGGIPMTTKPANFWELLQN